MAVKRAMAPYTLHAVVACLLPRLIFNWIAVLRCTVGEEHVVTGYSANSTLSGHKGRMMSHG